MAKHVKCINCGETFSYAHKCPPRPRQPTYTISKPTATTKLKDREQDEINNPRSTPFDKGVSGTTIRASKFARATKQPTTPVAKSHAASHNAKFIKCGVTPKKRLSTPDAVCPVCGCMVKERNLNKHTKKLHSV